MNTAQTLPPPIGWLDWIVSYSPRIIAQRPIYKIKKVPLESARGKPIYLVDILLDGQVIRHQADIRDIHINGRA